MYETMRYWDEEHLEWDIPEREYTAVWRRMPKWVVSRTLKSVGPNASVIEGDLAAAVRELKDQHEVVALRTDRSCIGFRRILHEQFVFFEEKKEYFHAMLNYRS